MWHRYRRGVTHRRAEQVVEVDVIQALRGRGEDAIQFRTQYKNPLISAALMAKCTLTRPKEGSTFLAPAALSAHLADIADPRLLLLHGRRHQVQRGLVARLLV